MFLHDCHLACEISPVRTLALSMFLIDRGGCHAWGRVCWLYLEHLVPLPLLDKIICPYLDYYILSIFHYLGSSLNYHTFIFDLMSSKNMYLYNAYIYTYILFHDLQQKRHSAHWWSQSPRHPVLAPPSAHPSSVAANNTAIHDKSLTCFI